MYQFSTNIWPTDAMSCWQDVVCSDLLRVDCTGANDFSGSIRHEAMGDVSIAELHASAHVAARNRTSAADDDDDFAVAFLQLEGNMSVRIDDREHVVTPGGLFFYDARKPIKLSFPSSFRHLFVRAPWSRWGYANPVTWRNSVCEARSQPLLRVAAAASMALLDSCASDQVSSEQRDHAILAVINLVAETVSGSLEPSHLTPAELSLTQRFERVLANRLQDPELSVEGLANELGVSSRYLNRVLVRSGGSVSTRVFEERLKCCADEFRRNPSLRIGDIAYRWGFNDSSHFSRAFKAFYGVSPRRFRAQALTIIDSGYSLT